MADRKGNKNARKDKHICSNCGNEYRDNSGLRRHLESKHPDSLEFDCPSCSRSFGDKKGMRVHHSLVHDEKLSYAEVECDALDCDNTKERHEYFMEQNDHHFCSSECNGVWLTDGNNPSENPEVRVKISESKKGLMTGENNPMTREEVKNRHPILNGEKDGHWAGVTGEDHPMYGNVEAGKKISESKKGIQTKPAWMTVEKTGHKVRSGWEKEVDLLLHEMDVEYRYEPRGFEYGDGRKYHPDFIVESEYVIEVKGWSGSEDKNKAIKFMKNNPEYTYVVVGSELPSDIHIEWKNYEKLEKVL